MKDINIIALEFLGLCMNGSKGVDGDTPEQKEEWRACVVGTFLAALSCIDPDWVAENGADWMVMASSAIFGKVKNTQDLLDLARKLQAARVEAPSKTKKVSDVILN